MAPKEPILTRKKYREHLEKEEQKQKLNKLKFKKELDEEVQPYQDEEDFQAKPASRKNWLSSYNRFLNVWIIICLLILAGIIAIQIFL